MSLLIKNWSEADWKELLKWAKIGANNAMIGEFTEVEELPPHGRLIDADALLEINNPIGKMMVFGGEYVYSQSEIETAPTILEAEEDEI